MKKGLETVKYGLFEVAMAPFGLGSGPTESKWVWDSFGPVFSPYGPTGGQNRPIFIFSGQFAVFPLCLPLLAPIGSYITPDQQPLRLLLLVFNQFSVAKTESAETHGHRARH